MIACQECHSTYRELLRECPACGSARPEPRVQERRCGMVSYVCLWLARVTFMIGAPVSLFSGCMALMNDRYLIGFGCIAVAPVYWGISVAIGLAIEYADSSLSS
jgi:hypothetical protein